MTTLVASKGERYASDYNALIESAGSDGAEWFNETREQAWQEFAKLGFPTARRGNELWKYTNVRPIDQMEFTSRPGSDVDAATVKAECPWDDEWVTLTFVDGRFQEGLSNLRDTPGLFAGSLGEAMRTRREAVEPHLGKHAPFEGYAFQALNTAFLTDGAFIQVDAGAKIDRPVQVLFITSADETSRATYPRVLFVCGENSVSKFTETYVNLAETTQLTDSVVEVVMGEGSTMRHFRVQIEHEKSHHIGIERIYQGADSTFTSTSYATGPAIGRYDIHTMLDAENAECTLHGIYLTTNRQHQSNEISTTHAKPRCKSHQFFKGVLAGKSQAVFSGKVIVEIDAQKSEADQKDLNLLLSRGAEVDTKPALEIYADDVKAGHGATAGHADQDSLFYLMSRGLSLDEARAMLVRGFAREIVDEFEPDTLREYLENKNDELMPALLAAAD